MKINQLFHTKIVWTKKLKAEDVLITEKGFRNNLIILLYSLSQQKFGFRIKMCQIKTDKPQSTICLQCHSNIHNRQNLQTLCCNIFYVNKEFIKIFLFLVKQKYGKTTFVTINKLPYLLAETTLKTLSYWIFIWN